MNHISSNSASSPAHSELTIDRFGLFINLESGSYSWMECIKKIKGQENTSFIKTFTFSFSTSELFSDFLKPSFHPALVFKSSSPSK